LARSKADALLLPSKPASGIQQPNPAKAKQKESAAPDKPASSRVALSQLLDEAVQEIDLAHHQQRAVSRLIDRVGITGQRQLGIEMRNVDRAIIIPYSPDAGGDEEPRRNDVRVLAATRRCLTAAAISIPDDRGGEEDEDEDEDNGERDIEFGGTVDGEAESPTTKTKTKTKKKKKTRSQSNRTKSLSPRTREVASPTSSPTRDNINSPFHLQSPLSDVASRPAKANAKNVGFAGVCEDDATSTKWKLVLDKTKAAGSGQVSCECFFVQHPSWPLFPLSSVCPLPHFPLTRSMPTCALSDGSCRDASGRRAHKFESLGRQAERGRGTGAKRTAETLQFMSVVEVEGLQARTLLGKCVHVREGGVERLDVIRLDSGTLVGEWTTQGLVIMDRSMFAS
jgi:hypothetical protein